LNIIAFAHNAAFLFLVEFLVEGKAEIQYGSNSFV